MNEYTGSRSHPHHEPNAPKHTVANAVLHPSTFGNPRQNTPMLRAEGSNQTQKEGEWQGIKQPVYLQWSDRRILLVLVLSGILLRVLVFISSPQFIAVGDAAEYVALARELAANNFAVPPHNTLYYPGTPWIYPPLGLELLAAIIRLTASSGWEPFYTLTGLMVVFDSLTVIPVFLLTKRVFDRGAALAAGLIFSSYPPDLYALSWSAYPQIVATFIVAWVLLLWVRAETDPHPLRLNVFMGLLVGVVALVHDLTALILVGVLLTYAVIGTIVGFVGRRGLSNTTNAAWVSLAVCSPFMAYWYAPRLWWVEYAASSASTPQTLVSGVNQFLQSFAIPVGVYYGYMIVYALLLIAFTYTMITDFRPTTLTLICFGAVPVAIMVYKSTDITLLERLPYYTLLPTTIFVAKGLTYTCTRIEKAVKSFRPSSRRTWAYTLAILLAFTAFTALSTVSYSASAHTYYAQCDYCNNKAEPLTDLSIYEWIETNTPTGSVFAAAGHIGYYIAAYDGRPTIVYHPLDYLTQPSERYESLAAYTLVFTPDYNIVETLTYIIQYNVSYIVVYNTYNITVPYFYKPVYSDNLVTLYQVNLKQMNQV
ncbi:hypothetical protein B9Q08_03260 [Candidatus Marsarchaeota G2 archaeon ECH_B_SAG-M15]|uniref:Glycosyltransferase RgtA/B/C/D-like domain-containing protein n=1 Tax=Candidatus Marsarchaeota G2 archaeon ECH_B_SAG-M15 TaxID=1978162 RepID=A0A2R6AXT8_9ARCH|nr:MAG: hypothetical protein B9Q08_03260 [Candidatus Marsarchaeota G2 archaeon ECH_B_SAG-M15]